MRILILTPFFPPNIGGVETFCKNLVKELSKQYNTQVCTIDWGKQKLFQGTGIKQFLDVFPKLLPKFLIMLEDTKFDIVHVQGFNAACMGALFKKAYGYKLYVTTHALYDFKDKGRLFRYFAKKILNSADKIFVEGDMVEQDILTLGIVKNKVFKYCHWCDQEVFKPNDLARASVIAQISQETAQGSMNSTQLVILCAGRLNMAEKGAWIVKAVEKELQGKEIKFVYAQGIPHEDMPKYFQMADICIIPSVYSESFPIVAIEAASCGCTLMVTDKGSLPELIKDFGSIAGESAGYVWGFKEMILEYYNNREALKINQQKTFEYAKEHFSPKNAEVFL